MTAERLSVVATGARTTIGLRSPTAAAALHAGISRLGEHPTWIDRLGNPMVGSLDALISPESEHIDRMLAMALSALKEVYEKSPELLKRYSTPIYLGLPESRPGFTESDAEHICVALKNSKELPFKAREVNKYLAGHAAGAIALAAAAQAIQRGNHQLCIVGGVDSYFHPNTMKWLDSHRQLAGEDGRSSFVPGEGAGFVLLCSSVLLERLGVGWRPEIVSISLARETALIKTEDLCVGTALTEAVQTACQNLPHGDLIEHTICDINGERYRAEEWGFVCLRLAARFRDPTNYLAPATLWGDTGAASIPLFAMLACENKNYAGHSLLWGSSEQGQRGAVLLNTTEAVLGTAR